MSEIMDVMEVGGFCRPRGKSVHTTMSLRTDSDFSILH